MTLGTRIGALLEVRTGEGRIALLLAVHSFLLGFSTCLFEMAGESLFLSRWGADQIAFVYLGWAVAVPLGGLIYSRLQQRIHITRVWAGTIAAVVVMNVLFAFALQVSETRWIPFAMMVARDLFWTLMLMEFWDLAGWLLNLQQAKRLFGVVGGGEMAGGILAGLTVGPLLKIIDLPHVMLITALGYFSCFLILKSLVRGRREGAGGGDDEEEGDTGDLRALFRIRYVALILLVPVAYTLAYDFIEYAYLGQAEVRYRTDPEGMAAFLGAVLATWQTLALLGRTFVSGRILTRFGLWAALFLCPLLLLLGGAALLAISLAAPGLGWLFWPVIFLKVGDAVLRNAIDKPSFLVLFQVLPQDLRVRVHAFQESISEPLTAGLSGVVLLVATQLLGGQAIAAKVGGVAAIVLAITAFWLVLIFKLRPEYDRMLARALTRHSLLGRHRLVPERSMIEGLLAHLRSADAVEVSVALETLRSLVETDALVDELEPLLGHEDAAVRREAARHAEEWAPERLRAALEARVVAERSPEVLATVLRAVAAVTGGDAVERLEPFLESEDAIVRRGALVGLLRHGGIAGVLAAGETILGLVSSSRRGDRVLAAEILGEVAIRDFHHPLAQLLDDADRVVRGAALSAAARARSPRLVPRLIAAAREPALAARAARALAAVGEPAVAAIEAALESTEMGVPARLRLISALGGIPGARAAALLLRQLESSLPETRAAAVRALEPHSGDLEADHRARLVTALERETARAAELEAAVIDLAGCVEAAELLVALDEQSAALEQTVVTLLAVLHPGSALPLARANLAEPSRRAFAMEIIERTASREEWRLAAPVLEQAPPAVRLGLQARLRWLLSEPDVSTWTRVAALHAVGCLAVTELAPAVAAYRDDADPVVRETARAALTRASA